MISTNQPLNSSTSSDVVIRVENLYKEYRLGTISHGTLYRDLQSWWARLRGKEDPNSIISTIQPFNSSPDNSTIQPSTFNMNNNPHFLALIDVSFELKRGEVLGIIGMNGAGKSTLLKILSEVTSPTKGRVKIKGRVASLLEVGTGFHPELTGRENIYLNGAILGMTKREIDRKFDEIVAFAEIEKFIDTPVKRYSSGMYVRLAFAVAAHLEPEILIVDEVLAVGDAQFQKKCLGKMGQVAKGGRTVLFVSHNMTAVQSLCNRAIWLNAGWLVSDGIASEVVSNYLQNGAQSLLQQIWDDVDSAPGNQNIRIHAIRVLAGDGEPDIFTVKTAIRLEFEYSLFSNNIFFYIGVHVRTISGECAFVTASSPTVTSSGRYKTVCHIPGDLLNSAIYTLHVYYVRDGSNVLLEIENPVLFEIQDIERIEGAWVGAIPGAVRPLLKWRTNLEGKL